MRRIGLRIAIRNKSIVNVKSSIRSEKREVPIMEMEEMVNNEIEEPESVHGSSYQDPNDDDRKLPDDTSQQPQLPSSVMNGKVEATFKKMAKVAFERTSALTYPRIEFLKTLLPLPITLFMLGVDIFEIGTGNGDLENYLSFASMILCALFTYPLVRYSTNRKTYIWDYVLLVFSVYEFRWKIRKDKNDALQRQQLEKYLNGSTLNRRHIWANFALRANHMVDKNLAKISSIFCGFPLLILKTYFAIQAFGNLEECSIMSVARFLYIVFNAISLVIIECEYDEASTDFQKAALFMDYWDSLFVTEISPKIPNSLLTRIINFFTNLTLFTFRFSMISFIFQLHPILGGLNLIVLIGTTWIFYSLTRPTYQNPTTGVPSFTYDVTQVLSLLLFFKESRFSSPHTQTIHHVYWSASILGQFLIPLGLFGWIYSEWFQIKKPKKFFIMTTVTVVRKERCENWIYDRINWLFSMLGFNAVGGTVTDVFKDHAIYWLWILCILAMLTSSIQLIYLLYRNLNNGKFPAVTATLIYGDKLLQRNWTEEEKPWVIKFLVLTVMDNDEFYALIHERCLWLDPFPSTEEEWTQLAQKLVNSIPPMDRSMIERTILLNHPMEAPLTRLLNAFYDNHNPDALMPKLVSQLCREFEPRMNSMTSYRIRLTCKILKFDPVVLSDYF